MLTGTDQLRLADPCPWSMQANSFVDRAHWALFCDCCVWPGRPCRPSTRRHSTMHVVQSANSEALMITRCCRSCRHHLDKRYWSERFPDLLHHLYTYTLPEALTGAWLASWICLAQSWQIHDFWAWECSVGRCPSLWGAQGSTFDGLCTESPGRRAQHLSLLPRHSRSLTRCGTRQPMLLLVSCCCLL